jgi:hypothetical protein
LAFSGEIYRWGLGGSVTRVDESGVRGMLKRRGKRLYVILRPQLKHEVRSGGT